MSGKRKYSGAFHAWNLVIYGLLAGVSSLWALPTDAGHLPASNQVFKSRRQSNSFQPGKVWGKYRTVSLSFKNGATDREPLILIILEALKNKIQEKGYECLPHGASADLMGEVKYKLLSSSDKRSINLSIKISFYETTQHKKYWGNTSFSSRTIFGDLQPLVKDAVEELLRRFPYSSFLGGVGILVGLDLRVDGFTANSPARDTGIEKGDRIIRVGGKKIRTQNDCVRLLRGMSDTPIGITVIRDEEELHFQLKRIPLNRVLKGSGKSSSPYKPITHEEFLRRMAE